MPKGIYKRTKEQIDRIKQLASNRKGTKYAPFSKEWKKRIGDAQRGKKKPPRTEEHRRKISENRKGKCIIPKGTKRPPRSKEWSNKISKARIGMITGSKNPRWKGGITPENLKIRNSVEARLWREAVFARDNYTCQKTKIKGGKLRAHHIQNFFQYPELRFAIDNGITLSDEAHKEFHKRYGFKENTLIQILKFINERIPKKI